MTTKTIRKLEDTCQRLENALRKNRNLLAAATQRASRREDQRRDRKYLALGYAVDAAMSHMWSKAQTRDFYMALGYSYDALAHTRRMQRVQQGVVECALLLAEEISVSDIETAARTYLHHHQQTRALQALADRHELLPKLAPEIAACSQDGKEFLERVVMTRTTRQHIEPINGTDAGRSVHHQDLARATAGTSLRLSGLPK